MCQKRNPAVLFFSSLAIPWFFIGRKVGLTKRKEIHPGMFFRTDGKIACEKMQNCLKSG